MQALSLKILTCATANLTLAMSVRFGPIKFFINLSIEPSTCFLRTHAWEYFIFYWLHRSIWFSSGVCLQSVDGSALVLKFFFGLHNSASPRLLIMTSLFILRYFEHGRTDWDSQSFKLGGGVLCHHSPRWISLAFGQYPLYSVGNPYICATTLYKPCYSLLPSLTLLTSIFCFQKTFAYARAELPKPHHRLICN